MSNLLFLNNSGNNNFFPPVHLFDPFVDPQNISNIPLFQAYHNYNYFNNSNSSINLDLPNEVNYSDYNKENIIKTQNKIYCPKCINICRAKQVGYEIRIQCKCGCKQKYLINNFVESQKTLTKKINCQSCAKEKTKYYCRECNSNFCQNCTDNHNSNLNHDLIPINQNEDICLEHEERYCSFCNDCKKDICLICESEHKSMRHHTFIYNLNQKSNKKKLEHSLEKINQIIVLFNELNNKLKEKFYNIIYPFKVIYNYKNNYGQFRTFDTLESLKSFNIDCFIKDFDKIINISKEKNIIKTLQSILQLSDIIALKKPISSTKKYNKKIQTIKKEIEIKILKNDSYINNKNDIMEIMNLPINHQNIKNEIIIERNLPIRSNYYPNQKNISYVNENSRNAISAFENSIKNTNSYINVNNSFENCKSLPFNFDSKKIDKEQIKTIVNCFNNLKNPEKNTENNNIISPKLIYAQDINYNNQLEPKEDIVNRVEIDEHNENINEIDNEDIVDFIMNESQNIIDKNTNSDFKDYIEEKNDENLNAKLNEIEDFRPEHLDIPNNDENEKIKNIISNNNSAIPQQSSLMNDSGIVAGYEILKKIL